MMGGIASPAAKIAVVVALGLAGAQTAPAVAQTTVAGPQVVYTRNATKSRPADAASLLLRDAAREGRIRVIAGLDMSLHPEDELSPAGQQSQAQALTGMANAMLTRVLGRVAGDDIENFEFIPFVALTVTPTQLSRLLKDPSVVSVEADIVLHPLALGYNVTLTETDKVWDKGFDGKGYTVAVLDSGVDSTHPAFAHKVVSEACYSTKGNSSTSLCPGGVASSTARGSAQDCSLNIHGCGHGTGVASVAVGNNAADRGIAHASSLIAIKVVSKKTSHCGQNSPCIGSFDADAIKGLKRVFALRKDFKIAAANYSYGSDLFNARCDDVAPAFVAAVDKLKQAGIATVVASGNDSSSNGIAFPACLSNVTSVASSDSGDNISDFSDFTDLVTLVAPGTAIRVAQPNNQYRRVNGTSFAAPAVAGAYAVLRDLSPRSTLTDLTNALVCGGQPVNRDGLVFKQRFDLLESYDLLKNPTNKAHKFDFGIANTADYWTPFLGTWAVQNNALTLTARNPTNDSNGIWFPACVGDATITAVMTRVNKDQSTAWGSGIIVNGTFDQKGKLASGYRFTFNIVDLSDPPHQNIVQIWRLDGYDMSNDSGSETQLCFAWVEGVKHGTNTLKVVTNQGHLQLYVNGHLDCSTNDTKYTFGNVMVTSDLPAPPNGTKQSFSISSVNIKPTLPPSADEQASR